MLKLKRGEKVGKNNIAAMPVDKWFAVVAGWALKIINSHEYWTPNPYTLILHNTSDIFREYAQRAFKPETPELADAQQRLNAALEEAALTAEVLGNQLRRYNNRMRANKWHGRSWGKKGW